MKIHIVEAAEAPGSYAVAIIRGETRRIAIGLAFDELIGVIATSVIDPSRTRYLQAPAVWREHDTHFGLTREQYEELLIA